MLSPPPRASRRALLTGGAAMGTALVAATTGCGLRETEGSAGAAVVDTTAPAVDADADLVETVGGQLSTALTLAVATGASFPALRSLSRPLAALHRAHLAELRPDDTDDAKGTDGTVRGSPATAEARLLRAEQKLHLELVQAAVDAESGALAQVFASMAAAVAQRLAVGA